MKNTKPITIAFSQVELHFVSRGQVQIFMEISAVFLEILHFQTLAWLPLLIQDRCHSQNSCRQQAGPQPTIVMVPSTVDYRLKRVEKLKSCLGIKRGTLFTTSSC